MTAQRLFWRADLTPGGRSADGEPATVTASRMTAPEAEANLVSSLTDKGTHMPVLDIDGIGVRVVESSTPGNYHLYIDKEMDWDTYANFLFWMWHVGIIERGYYSASIDRRGTFVRKPGVVKDRAVAL